MAKIKLVKAREILDSRGNPTVETTVVLDDSSKGVAATPSGASVSTHEALELRDNDPKRFRGLGVLKAAENVNNVIATKLIGQDGSNQREIDALLIALDGTPNKTSLGANAMLSVSMAVAKAAARSRNVPLYTYLRSFINKPTDMLRMPTPAFNLINGGKHAGMNIDFQEFLLIPATSKTIDEAVEIGANVYHTLQEVLKESDYPTLVGDEGGFAPILKTNREALGILKQGVEKALLRYGFDVFFGIDAASATFYQKNVYKIKDRANALTSHDFILFYEELIKEYPLLYLEDPLSEDDFDAWAKITQDLSAKTLIVGDDLTATNPQRLQMALDKKAITAIIIKPNQIGTVIEALAVAQVAKEAGLKTIVSHRSGETTDDFIADFAVAVSADYVKFGAPARGERVVKYNRLLQIGKEIQQTQ